MSFAQFGAGEVPPLPLISRTYGDLLSTLGSALTSETLVKIAESNDPFAIPDQAGTDVAALRKRMREFRELIETKGWRTPEARAQLVNDLLKRAGQAKVAVERTDRAVIHTLPERIIEWPGKGSLDVAPDNQWIVFTIAPEIWHQTEPSRVVLFNRETNQRREHTTAIGSFEMAKFSPDGKSILFADVGYTLKVVPFANGKLDWAAAKTLGTPKAGDEKMLRAHDLRFGADPNRVYEYSRHYPSTPFLFDFKAGTRTPVELKEYVVERGWKNVVSWGVVPGTDRLYMLTHRPPETHLHEVIVDASGKCTKAAEERVWNGSDEKVKPYLPFAVTYASDGKTVIGLSNAGLTIVDPGGQARPLRPAGLLDEPKNNETAQVVQAHPVKNEVAVVIDEYKNGNWGRRVEIVDVVSEKRTGTIRLENRQPDGIQFSRDGAWLVTLSNQTDTRVLNYEMRRNP